MVKKEIHKEKSTSRFINCIYCCSFDIYYKGNDGLAFNGLWSCRSCNKEWTDKDV